MIEKHWYCNKCGKKNQDGFKSEFNLICPICSYSLELIYEGKITWNDFDKNLNGVIKYAQIIPVSIENLKKITDNSTPEFTKPIESKQLANFLGVKSVHLLTSIGGPSGTFKDNEAAVVIAKCLDWNLNQRLSWHSTGNTARAYREYAIKAGFKSDSYFPLSCINKFKGATEDKNNNLIAYSGSFQKISHIAKERAKNNNTLHLAPLPWKIEGKAILAYAIFENLPETNIIVQTIAGGYGVLGLQLGIKRLHQLNLLRNEIKPKYNLFQIEGADTIAKLMTLNKEISETDLRLPVNPFEPTLQSTNPLSTFNLIRNIILETNSNIDSVTTEDVISYKTFFEEECHSLGIDISFEDEKSPFISWAGLVNASNKKRFSSSDNIVIIITGSKRRNGAVPKPSLII
ncbi:MAG: pyridoxal-phosphate dependent enzyme [Candidatus Nomurabacteria bacterium]|nr:pyridoxal-phosphate dependent enzyme [Candidatus Nomurabacteria bacterium]